MWFFVKIYTTFIVVAVLICLSVALSLVGHHYYKRGYTDGYQSRINYEHGQ